MSSFPAGAVVALKIRKIIRAFEDAGATNPESAISPEKSGIRTSLLFHRLVANKVLVSAGNNTYYLDRENLKIYNEKRRKRFPVVLLIVLILVVLGMLYSKTR
ncbi:MAG: hypothetical protein JNL22_11825 [Bacteroidales bacterium]|jgi:hypothetical protein|nr:hypothetical protein [Bacteroidales bacterium]